MKKKNQSLDERKALAEGLAGTVQKIHAPWLEERRKQSAEGTLTNVVRREPFRNPNKVGHNNSGPCGSGKIFVHTMAALIDCTESQCLRTS